MRPIGQHKGGLCFHGPKNNWIALQHFPWQVFSVGLCHSLKAEPRMRFKFCTWNKAGATLVGVHLEWLVYGFVSLCSALLCYSKRVRPGCCLSFKPRFSNNKNHRCMEWLPDIWATTSITHLVLPCSALQSWPKGKVKFTSHLGHTNEMLWAFLQKI